MTGVVGRRFVACFFPDKVGRYARSRRCFNGSKADFERLHKALERGREKFEGVLVVCVHPETGREREYFEFSRADRLEAGFPPRVSMDLGLITEATE